MGWKVGDGLIGQAELLVISTRDDRDLWKRGTKPSSDWAANDPKVGSAYAARDKVRLYVSLLDAMVRLSGLRALGRAVLFLSWRMAMGEQEQRRLVRQAAAIGISETTLDRAKQRLRMRSVRRGGIAAGGRWYVAKSGTPAKPKPEPSKPSGPQLPLPLDR